MRTEVDTGSLQGRGRLGEILLLGGGSAVQRWSLTLYNGQGDIVMRMLSSQYRFYKQRNWFLNKNHYSDLSTNRGKIKCN